VGNVFHRLPSKTASSEPPNEARQREKNEALIYHRPFPMPLVKSVEPEEDEFLVISLERNRSRLKTKPSSPFKIARLGFLFGEEGFAGDDSVAPMPTPTNPSAQSYDNDDTEVALKKSESLFPLYLSLDTTDAIIVTSKIFPFPIVHVNKAWEQLSKFQSATVVGRTCAILQGPATDKTAVAKAVSVACIEGSSTMTVLNYKHDSLEPFLNRVELSKVPGRNDLMIARLHEVTDAFELYKTLPHRTNYDSCTSPQEADFNFSLLASAQLERRRKQKDHVGRLLPPASGHYCS
jgi:hypothetical protein